MSTLGRSQFPLRHLCPYQNNANGSYRERSLHIHKEYHYHVSYTGKMQLQLLIQAAFPYQEFIGRVAIYQGAGNLILK